MKLETAALAAAAIAGMLWANSALAQGVPPGSYRQSCADAHMEGDALVATCQTRGGGARRTALAAVGRCAGDIGNNDGVLQCSSRAGQLRGSVLPGPGYAGPQPGYGAPPPGYGERRLGEEERERCIGLHRESERLRGLLSTTVEPYERGRLEGRLREVHEQEEHCR